MASGVRLTAKQEVFAGAVAEGASLADSYRRMYDVRPGTQAKSIWEGASRVAANITVAARTQERKTKAEARMIDSIEAQRQAVLANLWAEATAPDNPPACRIRALELLGRTGALRLFEERVNLTREPSAQEVEEELQRRLEALLG